MQDFESPQVIESRQRISGQDYIRPLCKACAEGGLGLYSFRTRTQAETGQFVHDQFKIAEAVFKNQDEKWFGHG